MIKFFIYGALLVAFTSCGSYRMLDGKSKPVYFTADSTVFNDTAFPRQAIFYSDLLYLRGNFINEVELKKGETNAAIIHEPVFFNSYGTDDEALIYPGDHLVVKGTHSDYTFVDVNGSLQRNRELLFFKTFHELERRPEFPLIVNASIQVILELEKQQKEKLEEAKVFSQLLFDS